MEEVRNALNCVVCLRLSSDPVIFSPCGHGTCAQCVRGIAGSADPARPLSSLRVKCPQCRAPCQVISNFALRAVIQALVESKSIAVDDEDDEDTVELRRAANFSLDTGTPAEPVPSTLRTLPHQQLARAQLDFAVGSHGDAARRFFFNGEGEEMSRAAKSLEGELSVSLTMEGQVATIQGRTADVMAARERLTGIVLKIGTMVEAPAPRNRLLLRRSRISHRYNGSSSHPPDGDASVNGASDDAEQAAALAEFMMIRRRRAESMWRTLADDGESETAPPREQEDAEAERMRIRQRDMHRRRAESMQRIRPYESIDDGESETPPSREPPRSDFQPVPRPVDADYTWDMEPPERTSHTLRSELRPTFAEYALDREYQRERQRERERERQLELEPERERQRERRRELIRELERERERQRERQREHQREIERSRERLLEYGRRMHRHGHEQNRPYVSRSAHRRSVVTSPPQTHSVLANLPLPPSSDFTFPPPDDEVMSFLDTMQEGMMPMDTTTTTTTSSANTTTTSAANTTTTSAANTTTTSAANTSNTSSSSNNSNLADSDNDEDNDEGSRVVKCTAFQRSPSSPPTLPQHHQQQQTRSVDYS